MRTRCELALLPLLCLALAGCVAAVPDRPHTALASRLRPQLAADSVIIDFCLLERPLGDPYFNHDLWTHTDELIVDLEKKAVLEDNGLRVGQVVGMTSAQLQTLLSSERWCLDPTRCVLPAGKTATYHLSSVLAHCDYDVILGEKRHELQVDRARFCVDVVAALTDDGKTKLTLTPKVETGEQVLPFQPSPERSEWEIAIGRPAKSYPNLSWHATLAPNEYLVVGARLDKPGVLGYQAFVQDTAARPVQRLLAIRTSRSPHAADQPTLEDVARAANCPPPLAVQATMSAVRASRP
ncbi:MAG: hypothetical protein L0Y71_20475 [Gemmataceae bacterium]|nr:hypothetical protein [Gemmataceae bacterium]